ncbi:MAG: cell division protein FtsZ, partial [Chthoniobacteraceae bacterium]
MIEIYRHHQATSETDLRIKILGLGGAGSNALDRILLDGFENAELVALNTDVQALTSSVASTKVQLGRNTTRGLGAGGDPEVGYAAAEEGADEIKSALEGATMVFLVAGLGGGTGSGSAPLIASYARAQSAMVVAFVTMPFSFEGKRRRAQAEEALESLQQYADAVICFENDRMGDLTSPRAGIQEAFLAADQTISQSVRAVAMLVQRDGIVRVGFDELQSALRLQNPRCLFGYGEAEGDNRAHAALERALKSPLMERGRLLEDAENVLVNVIGGPGMTLN